jgi:hypothetical protein
LAALRGRNYPKSLFLLRPLFTGYEMNSIGYKAQESVRLPDDLDLDATLVDWAPDDATLDFDFPAEEEDAEEAPESPLCHRPSDALSCPFCSFRPMPSRPA